jgi:hypothetical protein
MGMRITGLAARAAVAGIAALGLISQAFGQTAAFEPVTDAMIQDPDPKDWLSWRRTLDSWGYSPLDQIDRGNVDGLRLVWVRPLEAGHQAGTPLVHNGVMYFPGPSDRITALDAPRSMAWEDGFLNDRREPDPNMPINTMLLMLRERAGGGTTMTLVTAFASVESMEMHVAMPLEEQMVVVIGQAEALLSGALV